MILPPSNYKSVQLICLLEMNMQQFRLAKISPANRRRLTGFSLGFSFVACSAHVISELCRGLWLNMREAILRVKAGWEVRQYTVVLP